MSAPPFARLLSGPTPTLGTVLATRTLKECLVIAGAGLLVTGLVVIWVLFFRRNRKRTRRYHHRQASANEPSGLAKPVDTNGVPSRGHRRRRQRHKRLRHPTLAETGGLPPVRRSEGPPSPFPP